MKIRTDSEHHGFEASIKGGAWDDLRGKDGLSIQEFEVCADCTSRLRGELPVTAIMTRRIVQEAYHLIRELSDHKENMGVDIEPLLTKMTHHLRDEQL